MDTLNKRLNRPIGAVYYASPSFRSVYKASTSSKSIPKNSEILNAIIEIILFKYLFSYIKTLESWLDDKIITQTPIAKCAVSLLQDFYFNPAVIEFKPDHVAVSCIALTFQIYGLKIPGMEDADIWYKAFCPDLTLDNLWKIIDAVLKVYEIENEVYR